MSDDLRTVISDLVWRVGGIASDTGGRVADAILAARYPAACPVCLGKGEVIGPLIPPGPGHWTAVCMVCPTIGKLLEVGAAVMRCKTQWAGIAEGARLQVDAPGFSSHVLYATDLIDHLRAVEP